MLQEVSANDWGRDIASHIAGILVQLAADPQLGLLP